jgi:hypothetical protein
VAGVDGVVRRIGGPQLLLGVMEKVTYAAELARAGDLPAQAVAERLRRLVVDFAATPQSDDMAILALRVQP